MKLYLAVISWGRYDENQEAEWFHFVAESYEYNDVLIKAREHLVDEVDIDDDEFKNGDAVIDDVWVNEVNEVDGYTVGLKKL